MSCCTPPVRYEQVRGVQLDIMLVRITYDRSATWLLSNTARPLGLISNIENLNMKQTEKIRKLENRILEANFEIGYMLNNKDARYNVAQLIKESTKLNKALSDLNEEVCRERRRSERIKP